MEPTARAVALVGAETVSRAEIFYTGEWKVGRGRGKFSLFDQKGAKPRTSASSSCATDLLLRDAIYAPDIPQVGVLCIYKTAHPFTTCLERFNRWHTR